jgi:L-asparagine transporter-like permease
MTYWFPAVPGEFWVVLFSAVLVLVNLRSVGSFGRFEFWFAMIKFATIVVFILAGSAAAVQRSRSPAIHGSGRISAQGSRRTLLAVFIAIYAFGGVEMLAVTTGESRSSKDIPRAARLTFFLLAGLYLGAITVLAGVMPWNHARRL